MAAVRVGLRDPDTCCGRNCGRNARLQIAREGRPAMPYCDDCVVIVAADLAADGHAVNFSSSALRRLEWAGKKVMK